MLREDGTRCAPDEPGELVHRGALVGLGYWNDAEKTAERYRPLPAGAPGRDAGLQLPEIAVFSGDTVRRDAEGFLYFIGRRDEMIKTSGYRVSPTEVEEVLYATRLVGECAAFGVEHRDARPGDPGDRDAPAGAATSTLRRCSPNAARACRPTWCPRHRRAAGPLPRNPNGKIDRKLLSTGWQAQAAAWLNPRLAASAPVHAPMDQFARSRRPSCIVGGQPLSLLRRARRPDAFLCLRPRPAARAGGRAARSAAERRRSCTTR